MQLFKLSSHHPSHQMQLYKLSIILHIKNRRLYKLEMLHINIISPALILDNMLDKQAIVILFLPSISMLFRTYCVLIVTTMDARGKKTRKEGKRNDRTILRTSTK